MAKIAKGAGCSVATAKRAIYKLEEAGWFIIIRHKNEGGKNDSNEYVPNWDQGRVAGGLGVGSQANEGRVTDELGSVTGERGVVRLRAANPVKLNPVKEPSESTQEKDIACGDVLADDLIDDRWRHASMWTFSTEDMEDAMRLTGLNSIEIDSKIDEFIAQAESAGELHDDWSPIWRVWIGLSAVDSESYKDRPAVYLDQDRYWTLAGDDGSHPAGQLEALGDDAHYDEDPPF